MRVKLAQKVDHFTMFESFPSNSCCSEKFSPNKTENLVTWTCEVRSIKNVNIGRVHGGGWNGDKGWSTK